MAGRTIWRMLIGSLGICFLLSMSKSTINGEEETTKVEKDSPIAARRGGDILRKNIYKYFRNIEDFHEKLSGRWKAPKELVIPDEPMRNLKPFRPCQETVDMEQYFRGESRDTIFFSEDEPEKKDALNDSCLYDGAIPVLTCKPIEIISGISISLCFCSNDEFNSSPFVYSYNGSHCLGAAGSVCDEVKLSCNTGFTCDDGICGGKDGWIERVFAGQDVWISEFGYEEIAKRNNESYKLKEDVYLNSNVPPIRLTCNPRMYNEILAEFIDLLTTLNTTAFEEVASYGQFMTTLSTKIIMFDIFIRESEDLKVEGISSSMGVEYNQNERCFDQFPRMSCVNDAEGLDRGYCVCSNFSKYFNYTEMNGRCVARKGSVCTIIRGSADLFCEGNLTCDFIGWPDEKQYTKRIPNPLTHLEIKICGGWSALFEEPEELSLKLIVHHHDFNETEVTNRGPSELRNIADVLRIEIVTFILHTILN